MIQNLEVTPTDIRVRVSLTNRIAFTSELIRDYLKTVEQAIFTAEMAELDVLRDVFPPFLAPTFDAVEHRARRYDDRTFNVDKAATGSIIIEGTAAALTIWLFDKTFGESFKESWKKTEWHAKFVETLSSRLEWKAVRIAENIYERREPHWGAPIREGTEFDNSERLTARDKVEVTVEMQHRIILVDVKVTVHESRLPSMTEALSEKTED
jgi:frataxin-like iron-binding protein CyaY